MIRGVSNAEVECSCWEVENTHTEQLFLVLSRSHKGPSIRFYRPQQIFSIILQTEP